MSVLIFANGELESEAWVENLLREATFVIAADGGAHHLLSLGRLPDVVIGDFDSLDPSARKQLEASAVDLIVHPRDKDESDLELALRYAAERFEEEILILGALGGRLDQLMANVLLLTDASLRERDVRIIERHQEAWIVDSSACIVKGSAGDLVSLLPLRSDVHIERAEGLRWPLRNEALVAGKSRGISNVMTDESATILVKTGMLLCIHTSKEWER